MKGMRHATFSRRSSRVMRAVAAFALLGGSGLTAVADVWDGDAYAFCDGGGAPSYYIHTDGFGNITAEEYVSWPGTTCDGNNGYHGAIKDSRQDGYCASVNYLEVFLYLAVQGQSCTTGAWALYTYNDVNGDSSVFTQMCANICVIDWYTSHGY